MRQIVIVGNGAAGVSAATAARAQDASASITILGAEPYLAYHRPRLSYVLGKNTDVSAFLLHDASWYSLRNITVRTSTVAITADAAQVVTASGERIPYDSLVIAAGSVPNIPPLPGNARKGVFALRTYDDLKAIEAYARDRSKVVIVGGGILGLEAAWAFKNWGKQVSVLERGAGLLKNQLDDAGMNVIGKLVEEKGVTAVYGAETAEITGQDAVEGVLLKDGRTLPADLVLLSTGVKPEVGLAVSLGLSINRGVVVNSRMQVRENVFAAGDVASFDGKVPGIWPVALEQGRVAGENAALGNATYRGVVQSNSTMVMGVMMFSAGDTGKGTPPFDARQQSRGPGDYRGLYLKDGHLVGAVLIGSAARKSGRVTELIERQARVSEAEIEEFFQ